MAPRGGYLHNAKPPWAAALGGDVPAGVTEGRWIRGLSVEDVVCVPGILGHGGSEEGPLAA